MLEAPYQFLSWAWAVFDHTHLISLARKTHLFSSAVGFIGPYDWKSANEYLVQESGQDELVSVQLFW